jgi:hypothetical protein
MLGTIVPSNEHLVTRHNRSVYTTRDRPHEELGVTGFEGEAEDASNISARTRPRWNARYYSQPVPFSMAPKIARKFLGSMIEATKSRSSPLNRREIDCVAFRSRGSLVTWNKRVSEHTRRSVSRSLYIRQNGSPEPRVDRKIRCLVIYVGPRTCHA